jgi:hypothetical protein
MEVLTLSKTYTYSFYLSFGTSIETEEELDLENPADLNRLRELTAEYLATNGTVRDMVYRADFGDIDLIED